MGHGWDQNILQKRVIQHIPGSGLKLISCSVEHDGVEMTKPMHQQKQGIQRMQSSGLKLILCSVEHDGVEMTKPMVKQ